MAGGLRIHDPQNGRSWALDSGRVVRVGRLDEEIVAPDPHVSRHHCVLQVEADGRLRVTDTSSHGTWINGVRLQGAGWARPGDRITLGGQFHLEVQAPEPEEEPTWAAPTVVSPEPPGDGTRRGWQVSAPGLPDLGPRYPLIRLLGRGGMGTVYLIQDLQTGQPLAFKVLEAGQASPELVLRFQREALVSRMLSGHPGIVQVHEAGYLPRDASGGVLYISMEYVDGEGLDARIKRGVEPREACRLVAETARAVAWAHAHGVIHRDLKPANVLLDRAGHVRLSDFGIAKALDAVSGITVTGAALGTPRFMAPEQLDDAKRVTTAADVYGLGALLYTALAGQAPIQGRSLAELIKQIQRGGHTPLLQVAPATPPALAALAERALASDPARRPASAEAVARELEAWLEDASPTP